MTEFNNHLQHRFEQQLRIESQLSEISTIFVSLPADQIGIEIKKAQRSICKLLGFDRSVLWQIIERDPVRMLLSHIHEPPASRLPDSPLDVSDNFPWILNQILRGEIVTISRLGDIPPEADRDRESLKRLGAKSTLILPLSINEEIIGALSFAHLREGATWDDEIVMRLRLVAQIFTNALARKQFEESLESRLRFEALLLEISAGFVNLPADRIDAEIEETQRRICECLEIDLSSLWQWSNEDPHILTLTHLHSPPEGPEHPWGIDAKEALPWVLQKMLRGELLVISTDNMPPEAAHDQETRRNFGVKSSVVIPLLVGGGPIIGVLSFDALKEEKCWPEPIVRDLSLVAQIFTNALSRRRGDLKLRESEKQLRERLEEIESLKKKLEKENIYLREEIELQNVHEEIIGTSSAMQRVLALVEQVAPTDATVLIQGETGTGKELLARAVHRLSARKKRPMVTINCASLPPTLVESELFGREKGAYTGALTRMKGRFEAADGATLFLDEIGELSLEVQGKLLRVLEQGSFERLGSTQALKVDVRIIAATNQDLAREVDAGRFRKDLYFRLNVFPINLPPLRERTEDIPPLVWTFIRQYGKKMGKRVDHIPRKCMTDLQRYTWPGNIRELRNVVERALIVSSDSTLEVPEPSGTSAESAKHLNLEDVECRHITGVLQQTDWRLSGQGGAAEILGLKRTTLQSKMKKLNIQRPPQ